MNEYRYHTDAIKRIKTAQSLVIYGAGTMGRALFRCLTEKPYNCVIDCFVVKSLADNESEIGGTPVFEISQAGEYKNSLILIALYQKRIPEALDDLQADGFENILPISFDGDDWTYIRSNWMECNKVLPDDIKHLSDLAGEYNNRIGDFSAVDEKECSRNTDENKALKDSASLHIYVAHSIYDSELKEIVEDKEYEIPIQVGAALTDEDLYEIKDSIGGDNNSFKNKQYCELTGIYWVWKNDSADFLGFSHYRRKFILTDAQLIFIRSGEVDIVVTEPMVNFDTVKGQYAKDHCEEDWNKLFQIIEEYAHEYIESFKMVQDSKYYYAYNMFIMKREIFNKYCEFIFPVLEHCEKEIGLKSDVYQNRYAGFLAERLLSVFINKHSEYKVAIADKIFLE